MFRPPPTIVEIGTEEDMKQFESVIRQESSSPSPIKKASERPLFESPPLPQRESRRNITISTPTAFDSP